MTRREEKIVTKQWRQFRRRAAVGLAPVRTTSTACASASRGVPSASSRRTASTALGGSVRAAHVALQGDGQLGLAVLVRALDQHGSTVSCPAPRLRRAKNGSGHLSRHDIHPAIRLNATALPYNPHNHRPRGWSVQRGLSAAIVAVARLNVRAAADKRYSLCKALHSGRKRPFN